MDKEQVRKEFREKFPVGENMAPIYYAKEEYESFLLSKLEEQAKEFLKDIERFNPNMMFHYSSRRFYIEELKKKYGV